MPPEPTQLNVTSTADHPSAATFTFHNEDHTIGNTLRYMLNKTPEVSFCGYSVPHPAEPIMNLRVQTTGPPATEVLLKSLSTIHETCEHVLTTFDAAVEKYKKKKAAGEE